MIYELQLDVVTPLDNDYDTGSKRFKGKNFNSPSVKKAFKQEINEVITKYDLVNAKLISWTGAGSGYPEVKFYGSAEALTKMYSEWFCMGEQYSVQELKDLGMIPTKDRLAPSRKISFNGQQPAPGFKNAR